MQFELLPFVVEALGYNQTIYPDIDRLYQSRKYEFYKVAKEHYLYNHQIIAEGSLLREEYCKKVLGILLFAIEEVETSNAVSDIIKKGWPYAYIFVENHTEIDLGKFLNNVTRKAGGFENVSDEWLNMQVFIAYFLTLAARKTVIENNALQIMRELLQIRWQNYQDGSDTRISLKGASIEELEKVKELKRQLYAKHGKFTNYTNMYGKFSRAETIAFIFDLEKISFLSMIEGVKFTETDIDELILAYIVSHKETEIESLADYMVDAMYIKYMAKAYKAEKARYFENNRETAYVELEGLEKELAGAKQEISLLSQGLSESEKIRGALEKEKARLLKELAEEKKNRQELNSLREFLFSLDQQEEYVRDDSIDLGELKDFKAVLIGGHEKWQARIKELLPEFIFIHPDNKAFDLRLLEGVKVVFVHVNYLNHAIYSRTMETIEGRDIKVAFINRQNEEQVLREVYKVYKGLK